MLTKPSVRKSNTYKIINQSIHIVCSFSNKPALCFSPRQRQIFSSCCLCLFFFLGSYLRLDFPIRFSSRFSPFDFQVDFPIAPDFPIRFDSIFPFDSILPIQFSSRFSHSIPIPFPIPSPARPPARPFSTKPQTSSLKPPASIPTSSFQPKTWICLERIILTHIREKRSSLWIRLNKLNGINR